MIKFTLKDWSNVPADRKGILTQDIISSRDDPDYFAGRHFYIPESGKFDEMLIEGEDFSIEPTWLELKSLADTLSSSIADEMKKNDQPWEYLSSVDIDKQTRLTASIRQADLRSYEVSLATFDTTGANQIIEINKLKRISRIRKDIPLRIKRLFSVWGANPHTHPSYT